MTADAFSWPRYRSCEVKRRHRSYRLALLWAWAHILRGEAVSVYACEFCAGWHWGHARGAA
jgi:hypothetical protein